MRGAPERRDVRLRIGARRLEAHQAGVGQSDVRRRVLRHGGDGALEDVQGAGDLSGLERLEGGAAFDEGPVRRQQGVEPCVDWRGRRGAVPRRRTGSRAAARFR